MFIFRKKLIISFAVFVVVLVGVYVFNQHPFSPEIKTYTIISEIIPPKSSENKSHTQDTNADTVISPLSQLMPTARGQKNSVDSNDVTRECPPGKEVLRKKLLDEMRNGVVMITTKSYAATQSDRSEKTWVGTGFIVDIKKGLIVTNHHVVGDMSVCTYEVKFSDGSVVTGRLKYFDPLYDFAFLTIDTQDFPDPCIALELRKNPVKINDTIYSMGNSAGDEFSTYKGTVFSIYETLGEFSEQSFRFSGLTVGGASGSPIFDEDGKVVGIIYGGKVVSGAALPIRYVERALESVRHDDIPTRRSLGVILRYGDIKDAVGVDMLPAEAAAEYRKIFPQAHNKILTVQTRLVHSEASEKLQAGDIIWKINETHVGPELSKIDEILDSKEKKSVRLEIYRNKKIISIELKTYELSNNSAQKFIQFGGTMWFSDNEKTRLMTGDKNPGIFISSANVTSSFKSIFKDNWFGNGRPIKITSINGKPINTLHDLETLIPALIHKKMFDVRYIDFMGQKSFDQTISADRQERSLIIKYDTKFDNPKIFSFDTTQNEWDIKDIKK
jgi:S1-C subfamily serine protease